MRPTLPLWILAAAGSLYLTAFFLHLAAFFGRGEGPNRRALLLIRLGFLVHTFFFFSEGLLGASGDASLLAASLTRFGRAMAFFSWALAFVYLVLLGKIQSESFGLILAPLLFGLLAAGLFGFHHGEVSLPRPLDPYFLLHLGTAFFAYASFTLSFAAAILYLVQHRQLKRKQVGTFYHKLPSLEVLESLIYQPMAWGVFLLVLAIGSGLLWSKSAFGTYWLGEPKTVTTIGIAFLYLVLTYLHYGAVSRGKRMVLLSLAAFAFVFFNFFGTHFLGKGLHQLFQ